MRNEGNMLVPDGRKIRRFRKERAFTQEELAAKSGFDRRTIQRVEKGEPTRPSTLDIIAQTLGVSLKDVLPMNVSLPGQEIPQGISRYVHSFNTFITDRTRDFVGREFVFDALDEFLNDKDIPSGYFLIEAKPGMGKSAFLSRLVEEREYAVHHFNIAAQGINTARQFLGNACARLITNYQLPYSELPDDFDRDGAFLSKLLEEVSDKLKEDERLVIAIDALDEVDGTSQQALANVLFLPSALPEKVYFVLTTRDIGDIHLRVANMHPFELKEDDEGNISDVRAYIRSYADRESLVSWMKKRKISIKKFVDTMLKKSEHNFMYVHYVLPELEQGAYKRLNFDDIPVGLENYYEDHWRRMGMMAKPLPKARIRIIYLFTALKNAVSCELLADFGKEDPGSVQEILDEWRQFLYRKIVDSTPHYSLYHKSFSDFLCRKDIVKAVGMSMEEANRQIAETIEKDLLGG